jgi:hypothetical protein
MATIWINTGIFETNNKGKKTSSKDLMSPEKKTTPKPEVKKIGSGKNDIIERADQKVVVEDGRELLK